MRIDVRIGKIIQLNSLFNIFILVKNLSENLLTFHSSNNSLS